MRKSLMEHSFSNQPECTIPRSTFDRSHGLLTAFDADGLIPVLIDEVMPGDSFSCEMSFLCRLSAPSFPIMSNLYLESFFFFVPYRLLWTNWQKFMGEEIDPGDSIAYTIPQITLDTDMTAFHGKLADYLQLPLIDCSVQNYTVSALPLRAYCKIWDDWFRDENIHDNVFNDGCTYGDGPDSDTYLGSNPFKRGKRHDYFTSALPYLQKGDAITLPLGTDAPVTGIGLSQQVFPSANSTTYETDGTGSVSYANYALSAVTNYHMEEDPNNAGFPNIRADLTNATAATVNEIRQAFQIQRFLEQSMRVGTRYTEIIYGIYGVSNAGGDARLNRPEYLGGGSTPININPIAVTADVGNFEAGELSAVGTGYGKHSWVKSFTEHGLVIGLANVRSDIRYQCEGIERF
jgi:hypothetical protein